MLSHAQKKELLEGAAAFGLRLDGTQIAKFSAFCHFLYRRNAEMDLTAVPEGEAVPLHLIDSLSLAAVSPLSAIASLLDVGSGAGFPGIPLKIAAPGIEVTLLESSEKRVKFLEAAIGELQLKGIHAVRGRAETSAHEPIHREHYDVVVARAVAHLAPLAEMLVPFVRVGGTAVAYKSAGIESEVEQARSSICELGGEVEKVHLLRGDPARSLIVLRKVALSAAKFPRSAQYLARLSKKLKRS